MITYNEFCDVAEMFTGDRIPFRNANVDAHSRSYKTSYTWSALDGTTTKFHIPEITDDGHFQFSFSYKGAKMIEHNHNIKKEVLIAKVKEMILREDFEEL